jgi:hypothetical protein
MKIIVLLLILFLYNCSSKSVINQESRSEGSSSGGITTENEHSPWKTITFLNTFSIMFPADWRITRKSNQLFLRAYSTRPIGVIIVIETNESLNSLSLGKYFVEYYKNVLDQKKILLKNLEDINLNGKPALRSKYSYKPQTGETLTGEQILLKHNNKFIYLVTEAPEVEFNNYALNLKWIIESIKFIN